MVLVGAYQGATLAQTGSGARSTQSTCERQVDRLGGRRLARSIREPKRTRHVSPTYPPLPAGTLLEGGIWIGEILIDAAGKVPQVWTIREVKLNPPFPALNKAIADAIRQWEYTPARRDGVAVPVCMTVTVNFHPE
jgi:hypothetical protein